MLFSARSALFFAFSLVLCLTSTLVQARPPSWDGLTRRNIGRRDAFSDSGLSSASWIWLPEPNLLTTAPVGSVAFIKTFATPAGKTASSAQIAMTADNNYTLWVNGQPIGTGNSFNTAQLLSAQLNASNNVFSVLATNGAIGAPSNANPAGLLAAINILYSDGSNETLLSNNTWLVSGTVPSDFPLPADLSEFGAAEVAIKYGGGPWGTGVTLAAPSALNLTGSSWIWSTSDASANAPVGTIGFRKTIVAPSNKVATSAAVLLSVDNSFQLYVNGQYIGSPPFDPNTPAEVPVWQFAQRFTVPLTPSSNIFTVFATNFPPQAGGTSTGAGLVAAIQVTYTDGTSDITGTDVTWLTGAFTSAPSFLTTPDSTLVPSILQGAYGMQPWGQLSIADALDNLDVPGNNAAAVAVPGTSVLPSSALAAPTVQLPSFVPSSTPVTTNGNSARARINALTAPVLVFLSIIGSIVM
ncbi:hypothetical protein B0H11DRAFT_2263314 [Mycena galericulata]|nr:hypothetical protein B0H11DRAFT_2263314 [Mycena galericulata]